MVDVAAAAADLVTNGALIEGEKLVDDGVDEAAGRAGGEAVCADGVDEARLEGVLPLGRGEERLELGAMNRRV